MTTKEHLTKHDREIAAIRKLVATGMRMLVQNGAQIKKLIASQQRTDATLDRLMVSLGRGGANGGGKR